MPIFPRTYQQAEPSAVWTINHGMGVKPVVSAKINLNGSLVDILPANIAYPSDTQIVITFSSPQSGEARLA